MTKYIFILLMKMMMIYVLKMMVLVEMVGTILVMEERMKIREGEAGGLALGVLGVLLMVVGGVMAHLKRRR